MISLVVLWRLGYRQVLRDLPAMLAGRGIVFREEAHLLKRFEAEGKHHKLDESISKASA